MEKNDKYQELVSSASDLSLLYVEDNLGLQKQATKIFQKFFKRIFIANDGQEGLESFEKNSPDIVISDLQMPKMSGLEMIKQIRELNLNVQVIVTSAYDDKEKLFEAISVGVNKYLKKPIAIDLFIETLLEVTNNIKRDRNQQLFNQYINDVFEHQDNMLMLLEKREPIIVNKKTLDFFELKNINEFKKFFTSFGSLLLKHNNFLYNQDEIEWLSVLQANMGKLFNVKIADKEHESRHFILKAYGVPKKEDFCILSFDDITELNLLAVYDKDAVKNENKENEKKTILNLFKIIKRNQSQVKLYNSYKGLNITNTGVLVNLEEDVIELKMTYLQQRAISINKYSIIESEILPKAIKGELKSINFETQQVVLENLTFLDTKPSEQVNIRVVPEDTHKVSIFYEQRKLSLDAKILDISIDGVNIYLEVIPPKFNVGDDFRLNIVLDDEKIPIIIDLESKLYILKEKRKNFEAVFVFEDKLKAKKLLVNYVAKRQMALIREFKMLKYIK